MSLMTAAEFRQSVTIPAAPEQIRAARVFVARALGESRVDSDVVLLLASELVTNSVRHSDSAVPGGVVTVTVAVGQGHPGRGDRPLRRQRPGPASRRARTR